jgi:phosphoserine phosphatase
MTILHVFDLDGTLLRGSACMEISSHVGQLERVESVEEAWGRGEVGHLEFYQLLLELWGELDDADLPIIVENSPWLEGIREVTSDIHARGERTCVISMSPQFFVDQLLVWGFDSVHGANVHPSKELREDDVMFPESKVLVVSQLMERYHLNSSDVIAYGDSASDIPLFETLSNTVAVNGSDRLVALAAASYSGGDIRDAYRLGRELRDGRSLSTQVHEAEIQ